MIKGDNITKEIIEQNIGNYILLGGHGIVNGLADEKNYKAYLKIVRLSVDGDGLRMYAKKYKKHNIGYLPEFEWNQEYIIINKKEYNKLKLKVDK